MTGCSLSNGLEKMHDMGNLVDTSQTSFSYVQEEVCLALW